MAKSKSEKMSDAKLDAELRALTLATAANGQLESQFQERLHEVMMILRDHQRLLATAAGKFECEIKLEVVIQYDPNDGSYWHEARAMHPTKPKPRFADADAYARPDGLKVLPAMVQTEIPT